jgi:TolB-like protein/class 3 adenylate cyclase
MDAERADRRLAAIFAADVEGYSRLMGRDERATLATLTAHRAVMDELLARYRGRVANTAGDSVLAEFASVVDAVECASVLQEALAVRNEALPPDRLMAFRIGIHVGDVLVKDGDLFGDGVNIAARLQTLAAPGGLCISEAARMHLGDRLPLRWDDGGSQVVKNIAAPVRVYHLAAAGPFQPAASTPPALPDRPSVAVLPFDNMSGDSADDYFADGMVEEITTALSRHRWLFVIARNSSFTFKGRTFDVKQVGRELGVRYVVEGSVRRAGARVRITGQLIDALTGAHLWADRFEGTLEDVFDLQDRVTESLVATIAPRIEQAEIERARRKPTDSLDAYDLYLRAMAGVHGWTREGNAEALDLFRRAVALDPEFAAAYGMAARCYSQRKASGWVTDRAADVAEAERLARRAAALGRDDAVALVGAGIALAFVVGDLDGGDACVGRALELNPSYAWGWLHGAWIRIWQGDHATGIDRAARAMRLSPADPHIFTMQSATAMAHCLAGEHETALRWAELALGARPHFLISAAVAAVSGALTGRESRAATGMALLRSVAPNLHLGNLADYFPIRRAEDAARWCEGLSRAGLAS